MLRLLAFLTVVKVLTYKSVKSIFMVVNALSRAGVATEQAMLMKLHKMPA